ncbi:fasciclin domain-containing protein [Phenylobacterium sp.]|uniref:fasciclin domain-containing protein n=1 Tax=Phenylobacterium sp. TaxID=1871053 RepID=UPI0025E06DF9|nr:fasciclin domain-containing protein [Phenylobacterium sp.]
MSHLRTWGSAYLSRRQQGRFNFREYPRMSRKVIATVVAGFALAVSVGTFTSAIAAEKTVQVGGAAMYPSKNIIQNAVNSKDHTTLVAAVKAAGLVDTLSSPGPFTVFAPTNAAFGKLPAGTVDTLVKPENKDTLTKILTYHVVSGRMSSMDIAAKIKAGGGKATLKTVQGEDLTATMKNGALILTDAKGGMSKVTIANVFQSNGVIHVVDTVLMP